MSMLVCYIRRIQGKSSVILGFCPGMGFSTEAWCVLVVPSEWEGPECLMHISVSQQAVYTICPFPVSDSPQRSSGAAGSNLSCKYLFT